MSSTTDTAKSQKDNNKLLIGLIVPNFEHPVSFNLIKYTEHSANHHKFNLIVSNTENNPNKEKSVIDRLLERNINGIIFSRISDRSRLVDVFLKKNIPVVVIDREIEHEEIPSIVLNNHAAGSMAASRLLESGCRKMMCITGDLAIKQSRERLNGFAEILENANVEFSREKVYFGKFDYESGLAGVQHLLNKGIEIDGIWAQSDLTAFGVMLALQKSGIKVPDDVKVIGMDNSSLGNYSYPSLTTIAQPFDSMCDKAVELIKTMNTGQKNGGSRYVFEPYLIKRESG